MFIQYIAVYHTIEFSGNQIDSSYIGFNLFTVSLFRYDIASIPTIQIRFPMAFGQFPHLGAVAQAISSVLI